MNNLITGSRVSPASTEKAQDKKTPTSTPMARSHGGAPTLLLITGVAVGFVLGSGAAREGRESGNVVCGLGIARDIIATNGIRHLERFGDFDEVMSGRGWVNVGVLKYIYGGQLSGPAATPQVLVIERSLDDTAGHISLTAERVVARKTGLDEIAQWVQSGAPTPTLGKGLDLVDKR